MTSGRDLFAPKLGVTLPLCGFHFVFFFLSVLDPQKTRALFGFWPDRALAAPWGFLTFQFLHGGALSLFFGAMALYILGGALESEWGTLEFTVFWLVASLGASLSAWVVGTPLVTDPFVVPVSMLLAYAFLYPDVQFLVFFVVPVKVKWMAWLTVGLLGWTFISDLGQRGFGTALVRLAGAGAGFLYFWIRQHGRHKARRATREAVAAVKTAGALRQDSALEKRNRELFPTVEMARLAYRENRLGSPAWVTFQDDLAKLVVPGVKVCKPVDFKGDRDGICVRCDGFAECSLRYVAGQPDEIVVRNRE